MAEKANPPSESPVMMRVVREEIPLSRREGEEVMRRRLSGESRSPSPPPFFEPSSSTAIANDTETATASIVQRSPTQNLPFAANSFP